MNEVTVYLLDTSSFIHRAYHASKERPTFTKEGVPNAAVYLFRTMIQRLRRDYSPDYMIAACDVHAATFRKLIYPKYKAQREAPPEDLLQQLPGIRRVMVEEGVPTVEHEGYEADDIIGTLAKRLNDIGMDNVIVSGDKDMAQLVGGRTRMLNTNKNEMLDVAGVERVFGVRPDQIVDLMALRGDTSDNVPGAPGIGDKGSLAIIKDFGTLEQALARSGEVSHSGYRKSLQNNLELIRLSKKLVTIVCNVPLADVSEMYSPF